MRRCRYNIILPSTTYQIQQRQKFGHSNLRTTKKAPACLVRRLFFMSLLTVVNFYLYLREHSDSDTRFAPLVNIDAGGNVWTLTRQQPWAHVGELLFTELYVQPKLGISHIPIFEVAVSYSPTLGPTFRQAQSKCITWYVQHKGHLQCSLR